MTPCVINRNLHRVPLLPWNGETQQLYVTIWGDEIVTYNTGGIPRCRIEKTGTNKKDHAHENSDQSK
jgi:hypothetical protein